jgi:hypothetical protein
MVFFYWEVSVWLLGARVQRSGLLAVEGLGAESLWLGYLSDRLGHFFLELCNEYSSSFSSV